MTRKRALGRQRDNSNKHTACHTQDWDNDELESVPLSSTTAPWHGDFGRKSLYRHSFFPKTKHICKRRRTLRPVLKAVLLKIFPIFAVLFVVLLTLPKVIFDVARYLTMSRPTILYGSPTDWKDVAGCLSRTHRRDVRAYFEATKGTNHHYTYLPLNPNVVWNWSPYSSSNSTLSPQDGDDSSSGTVSPQDGEDDAPGNDNTELPESSIPRRRLLIAQYSGKGSYQKLLQEVEPINRAYSKRWGHDYTTLVGTALKFPGLMYEASQNDGIKNGDDHRFCRYYNKTDNVTLPASSSHYNYESQSTFNKIPLLFKAMEESPLKYDQVLILDSDTMIVDFEYDITSLLLASNSPNQEYDGGDDKIRENGQSDVPLKIDEEHSSLRNNGRIDADDSVSDLSYFLVAYRVWKFDWLSTWDVNAGITLWNLRHPNTRIVAEEWLKLSLSDPKGVLLKNDDQYYLQRALQKVSGINPFVGGGAQKNAATGVFGMQSFRNWWSGHSFLPAFVDYFRASTSRDRDGSNVGGSTAAGAYNDHTDVGVGIRAVRDEFEYYNATVIKHFKRDTASWSRTGLEQRLLRIREAKAEICRRWPKDCLSQEE